MQLALKSIEIEHGAYNSGQMGRIMLNRAETIDTWIETGVRP